MGRAAEHEAVIAGQIAERMQDLKLVDKLEAEEASQEARASP